VFQHQPVVVIGAGPIGLSAAANLIERDVPVVVLEAGERVAASVRSWGHVRLFSPWKHCIDPASRRLLEASGWTAPDPGSFPAGDDIVDLYLEPLAALPAMAETIRLRHNVTAVSRLGVDKTRPAGRDDLPFVVNAATPDGEMEIVARAVIDASGTWTTPNPIGSGGTPALGELHSRELIFYGIPDVLGTDTAAYAGTRTAVIGSGHSAQNAVRSLATLARSTPNTATTWIVRRGEPGQMFGGGADDELPERGELGAASARLVQSGAVELVTGFRTRELIRDGESVWLTSLDGRKIGPFDRVVATTGSRPDLEMLRELRLDTDDSLESVRALAPLIDPNIHSCGTVAPHGAKELEQPEPNFFVIGNKSFGRAPTFLLLTGYEQARSVVAAVDGDRDAAETIELELPETGVCSVDVANCDADGLTILENACC